jgi:CRISPR/Cas system CSM-associated protein Csm4 (group 5 of RAMP superfamily)
MAEFTATATFLLEPVGRFRFGSHPANPGHLDALPGSDTLAGALLSAAALLHDGVEELIARGRAGDPPFLISSALPHLDGRTPFVPRPHRLRPPAEAGAPAPPAGQPETERKAIKRVSHVEVGALPWLDGRPLDVTVWGPLLCRGPAPAVGDPWERATIPGVTLDRASGASALYHHAMVAYADGRARTGRVARGRAAREATPSRLRWAVHVLAQERATVDLIHRWLSLLALTGIGGRRSRGAGTFQVERHEPALLPLTPEPRGLLLSWVSPRPDEVERGLFHPAQRFGYRLDERFGWINSPFWLSERSRRVLMVAEGSYLSPSLPAPVGRLVDVTPGDPGPRHPVFRFGFGLFLDEERLS